MIRRFGGKTVPAFYHPDYSSDASRKDLEMLCVRNGTELNPGGARTKRCFFMRMDSVVGASNGEETKYVYAEYLISGEVHGRPITAEELRRKGAHL